MHLIELERQNFDYMTQSSFRISSDLDSESGYTVFRVYGNTSPPKSISAILGDVIHNARAALDHSVCELARLNGQEPHQQGGFRVHARAKREKLGSSNKLKGISEKAERLILRLKSHPEVNGALYKLSMLDNVDKHQTIVPTCSAVLSVNTQYGIPGIGIGANGNIQFGATDNTLMTPPGVPTSFKRVYPLADGSEIYRAPPGFHVEVTTTVLLAFGKFNEVDIDGEPMLELTNSLVNLVERIIQLFERSLSECR